MDDLVEQWSFMHEGVSVVRPFKAFVRCFEEFVLDSFTKVSFGAISLLEVLGMILIHWQIGRSVSSLPMRRKRVAKAFMTNLRRRRAKCV